MKGSRWVVISFVFLFGAVGVLLMALVVRANERRKVTDALAEDFVLFAGAFEQFHEVNARWPETQLRGGALPKGMDKFLGLEHRRWLGSTPVGGHYYWSTGQLHNGVLLEAAIAVEGYGQDEALALDIDQLMDLDERVDDGNLLSGKFRLGRRDTPVWLLAE